MKRLELTGKKFNRLLVLSFSSNLNNKHSYWDCLCDCGKIVNVKGTHLKDGSTKSCGCYGIEKRRKILTKEKGHSSWNLIYKSYIRKAKIRELEFNISFKKFKEICSLNCFYCNSSPKNFNAYLKENGEVISKCKNDNSGTLERAYIKVNGIDRVNPDKGYNLNNCVPCCSICNMMKLDHTKTKFFEHIEKIVNFQKKDAVNV